MGSRVYAPDLGRWISPDRYVGESPKRVSQNHLDTNLYGYSRNNPVTYHDPSGNLPILAIWLAKAAAEGAVDTLMDAGIAMLTGEKFEMKDAAVSFLSNTGMALFGMGVAAHGKKLYKLAELIRKNADKAKDLIGPLRKMLEIAGDKLGPMARKLRDSLDDAAKQLKSKASCGKGVCTTGCCFVSGTLVATSAGLVPIEHIELGDRVMTTAPASIDTEVDETWVHVTARMELPGHPGDVWDLELLRPASWLEEQSSDGQTFEFVISKWVNGTARIIGVEQAPTPGADPGRVVTGRFDHLSQDVYELRLENSENLIRVTWDHPFFSADRNAFVAAGELEIGERLETASGTTVLTSKNRLEGSYRVYNLEVEGEHEYFVSTDAVRVHNCGASELPQMKGMSVAEAEKTLAENGFTRTHVSNSPARNQTWSHADGSEARIHPYGNQAQAPYRSANNAHVHKQSASGAQLTDRGIPSTNPAETHIGISNPPDLPAIRGRPHGAGTQ